MAGNVSKTWNDGEVVLASDLNQNFADIIAQGPTVLSSPRTAAFAMGGNALILDTDGDFSLQEQADDIVALQLGAVELFTFDGSTAASVNGILLQSSATGSGPTISAQGSDTNVDLNLTGKGTGRVMIDGAAPATSTGQDSILAARVFAI